MTNKAPRHHRYAALNRRAPTVTEYEITDPAHRPDLNNEFAGVKVRRLGAKQVVSLNAAQAKFYLDQGAIKPVAAPAEKK